MSRLVQVMVVAALWGAPQVALGQSGEPVVMLFAGDLMLSGHVDGVARGDTTYVFRYWKPGAEADIFMANLEEPITVHDRKVEKEFNFKMDPQFVGTLRDGRLTLVTVANNHVADYGREGLLETIGHLERAGIPFVGIGTSLDQARSPVVLSVKGKRIGFLGYFGGGEYAATDSSGGFAPRSERMIIEDVRRADSTVDYLVVNFHWGTERAESPERWQVSLAHEVVRAGADLVVGHHPHVLQGAERYQSGIIAYSLGNFVFGGNSRQNYDTAVLKVVLDDRGPSAEIIPVSVRGYQPRPATGSARESVLSLVSQRSTLFQHPLVVYTGGSP